MSENCYGAFGLQIASEIALPELVRSVFLQPDIKIQRAVIENPTFEILGVGKFFIPDDSHIFFEGDDLDSVRLFLLGTAMGILLQKRGFLVLHGNAIVHGDHCVMFIGASGAGKSTLAGYFMRAGYQILADDVCAIRFNPDPEVIPSYPQIKLWQDSAELLGYDTKKLKPILKRENKFMVPLGEQYCTMPKPIKKIYLLGALGNSKIQRLSALIQNTYRLQFIETPAERARHLEQCQLLLKNTELQSLSRPHLPDDGNFLNHWASNSLF